MGTKSPSSLSSVPLTMKTLEHSKPPPAVVRKRLLGRVPSSIVLVSVFLTASILIVILNRPKDSVLNKSSQQFSPPDRLAWQRTAFHFQLAKNFLFDPNGLFFHMGWYHLFYQYNPYAPVWGNMTWGHAVSKDMINWFELPVALRPSEWYDIKGVFSGSATILPNGQIFILYTGNTEEFALLQCKAAPANISDPLLVDWVKYHGNPLLYAPPRIYVQDFRDPSTVWTGPDGKHRLIIGSRRQKTGLALIYHTTDYNNYVLLDEPLHWVPNTGMWECVDFYPVSLTNDSALEMGAYGPDVKHVIKEGRDRHYEDWYSIGTYEAIKDKWTPDDFDFDLGAGYRCDYGKFYASKSLYDPLKKRRVTWDYVGESDKLEHTLSKGWANVYNIGRTVVLDRKTGANLLYWPIEEIESLRNKGQELKEITLEPGSIIPLDIGTATQLDIVATFEVDHDAINPTHETNTKYGCLWSSGATNRGSFGPFGIVVLADETLSELTPIYFYIDQPFNGNSTTHFCTDKLRSSLDYDGDKGVYGSSVTMVDGEKLTMRLLVDHSIVEAFAQGGRTVITSRVYPTKAIYDKAKVFLFNNATRMNVKASLKIWQMAPTQIQPYPF
ncbi:beta-fructofuranosidase, soluble isoenzyme I-like [Bidens hawaiensis]|uniref:beta-fructofuranosidase, soluble isoenzyme I-like n=1 Tax=Bidens hawaiensis TaxID=980011 RepID=UPI00404A8614